MKDVRWSLEFLGLAGILVSLLGIYIAGIDDAQRHFEPKTHTTTKEQTK